MMTHPSVQAGPRIVTRMTPQERFLCALRGERSDAVPWGEMSIEGKLRQALLERLGGEGCLEQQLGMSHVVCAGPYWPPGFIEKRGGVRVGLLQERKDLERMVFPDPTDERFYAAAKAMLNSAPPGLAVGVATDLGAGARLMSGKPPGTGKPSGCAGKCSTQT